MIVKRSFDVLVATAALLVLIVPMAAIGIAVRLTNGPPVLFRQTRPGWHGEPFELLKFRTMRVGDGEDAARLTRLGERPQEHEPRRAAGALERPEG